ncbi:MAG: GNAT family N-acetyltransferase [Coprobacillus sp.]
MTKFLRWTAHQNVEVTKSLMSIWIDNYINKDFYQWAIVLKENNEPIGTISVVDQDEKLNLVHIGYCIGAKWWNKGITSEAFSAIISFLFEQVEVNRIEAQHDTKNPNSGKVMLKCGLKYEGTLREADINNKGNIIDVSMYSILAKEYYKN